MVKLSSNFTGVMDMDSDDRYIKKGNYRLLQNGIIDRDAEGGAGVVKNLKSSKLVTTLPNAGSYVGGEYYKNYFYPFYYNSITNELTLYRVNPKVDNDYDIVFQKQLEDTFPDSPTVGPEPPSWSTYELFASFFLMNNGSPFVFINSAIESQEGITVNASETAGDAITDISELNTYIKLVNPGTVDEYIIFRVPIVFTGDVTFNTPSPSGTTIGFDDFSEFQSYFTVKDKGLSTEYLVCTAPVTIAGNVTVHSTSAFAGYNFVLDVGEGGGSGEAYRTVIYQPVTEITDINFVENQATGDLMCYWVDGVNPPFKINISWLLEDPLNGYSYVRDMFNAKVVPSEPTIRFYRDPSISDTSTKDKLFQFALRYKYMDGEKTPLSTYSRTAFLPSDLLQSSSLSSASRGYYVNSGVLYRFKNFDSTNSVALYTAPSVSYNGVIVSNDESVIIIYSIWGGTELIPMYSYDRGLTFSTSSCPTEGIRDICMSDSGQYIYFVTELSYFKSDDYGKTFTRLSRTEDSSHVTIKCSADGNMVVFGKRQFEGVTLYASCRIFNEYGETLIEERKQTSPFPPAVAVSPSGRAIVCQYGTHLDVSTDYGTTYTEYTVTEGVRDIVIYDNGIGFADGYRTTDFFNTRPSFSNASSILDYNYGVVYYLSGVYTLYDLTGALVATTNISHVASFNDSSELRQALGSLYNAANVVNIEVSKANDYVEEVEVYAIDIVGGNAYLVKTIKNEDIPELGTIVTFKNNLIYRLLSTTEKQVLFSNVPDVAKHQALVGNRLFYLNYIDGKALPTPDFSVIPQYSDYDEVQFVLTTIDSLNINVTHANPSVYSISEGQILVFYFTYTNTDNDFLDGRFIHVFQADYSTISDAQVELNTSWATSFPGGNVSVVTNGVQFDFGTSGLEFFDTESASLVPYPITYRKGTSINIGIAYYDEFNRGSFPIFDEGNVSITEDISAPMATMRVTINHAPPSWARKFKFVRTDRNLSQYIIAGFQYAKAEDNFIYLMKYDSDKYLPDPGMYIDAHLPNGSMISFQIENKVTKEADFVQGAPAGDWIVIKSPYVNGYTVTDVINGDHDYYTTIFYARLHLEVADSVLYYEIPGEHYIYGGYHMGDVQDQTDILPAIIDIANDGNVFYIGGANIEIQRIGQDIVFYNGGRPIIEVEGQTQINRYSGWTHSDMFVQDTGYNGLSMFNLGLANYGDLEISNGEITAVKSLDTNLFVWQEDKVGYLPINKNVITSALGEQTLIKSSNVVGDFIGYTGEWGTQHSMSLATHGGVRYFADAKRKAICRLSLDGVTDIVSANMETYLRPLLDTDDNYIGIFNKEHKEYWIASVDGEQLWVFSEDMGGWSRIVTPFNVDGFFVDNDVVFGIDGNLIYSHFQGTNNGITHGVSTPFRFEYVINDAPSDIKVFNALQIEANVPLETTVQVAGNFDADEDFNESVIPVSDFETREGEYFAYIPAANNMDVSGHSIPSVEGGVPFPIGMILSVDGNTATFTTNIASTLGHSNFSIFVVEAGGSITYKGQIDGESGITRNTITSTELFDSGDAGLLAFVVENSYLNGHKLRAPFVRIVHVHNGTNRIALYSTKVEVNQSKNE